MNNKPSVYDSAPHKASGRTGKKMETKHTPIPWHIAEYGENTDGSPKHYALVHGGETIANFGTSEKSNSNNVQSNVMFAARACNNHDALVDALAQIEVMTCAMGGLTKAELKQAGNIARAAIAKARQ